MVPLLSVKELKVGQPVVIFLPSSRNLITYAVFIMAGSAV